MEPPSPDGELHGGVALGRGELPRLSTLLRDESVVVRVAEAGVQRETAGNHPVVHEIHAQVTALRHRSDRPVFRGHLERHAAPEDQLESLGGAVRLAEAADEGVDKVESGFELVVAVEQVGLVQAQAALDRVIDLARILRCSRVRDA